MFTEMRIDKIMDKLDCLAVDGGYTLFLDQVINNTHLNETNVYHPMRKAKGISLSETEIRYNNTFGSFRSKIESTFADLGNTFERLNNCKYIRVDDIQIFTLQMKLACLLLNIKKIVKLLNIPDETHHAKWLLQKFDYNYQDDEKELPITFSMKTKLEHSEQMLQLQQQFIGVNLLEESDPVEVEMTSSDECMFDVEKIIDHQGEGQSIQYLIKWAGWTSKHNTWEPLASFTDTGCIDRYWARIRRRNKRGQK